MAAALACTGSWEAFCGGRAAAGALLAAVRPLAPLLMSGAITHTCGRLHRHGRAPQAATLQMDNVPDLYVRQSPRWVLFSP